MGRLVINNSMTVNGSFEAPAPEPDGWLVLDSDSTQVSLEQFFAADDASGQVVPRGADHAQRCSKLVRDSRHELHLELCQPLRSSRRQK